MQAVEAKSKVREPLESPQYLPPLPEAVQAFLQENTEAALKQLHTSVTSSRGSDVSAATDLEALIRAEPQAKGMSVHDFEGGEDHAWKRLNHLTSDSSRQVIS